MLLEGKLPSPQQRLSHWFDLHLRVIFLPCLLLYRSWGPTWHLCHNPCLLLLFFSILFFHCPISRGGIVCTAFYGNPRICIAARCLCAAVVMPLTCAIPLMSSLHALPIGRVCMSLLECADVFAAYIGISITLVCLQCPKLVRVPLTP